MRDFARLYSELDSTTRTSEKIAAMRRYFENAAPGDAAWAVYFLSGRKPKLVLGSRKLAELAFGFVGLPEWLYFESYDAVGDVAETIALLLPDAVQSSNLPLAVWVEDRLLTLKAADEETKRAALKNAWQELDFKQRLVWNKLITGEFRVGVSQQLVIRALAEVTGVAAGVIAHRLMGDWQPTPQFYDALTAPAESTEGNLSRPYPFCLAFPLEGDPSALGDIDDWQAEWKWDGIRAQLIKREGESFIWTRGEELVTDRYPEVLASTDHLPDGVALDGELLAWRDGEVLSFALMQRRIGRKVVSRKLLDEVPVVFLAYDLLELGGQDIREKDLISRRRHLEEIVGGAGHSHLLLSPIVCKTSWEQLAATREQSRERRVEGFMLKRRSSPYRVGRQRGDWWKWKINPYTVDAVLIYAQRGSGKRASLYTDYTFGIWDGEGNLVPFAKAYSGLTDEEIAEVDAFVRANTIERFGPVRTVKPTYVFELAFEGIQRSSRHRSGIAVRFPRISRWRRDKKIEDSDTLESVMRLLGT
jgi:ATP-dependent DNA ligase